MEQKANKVKILGIIMLVGRVTVVRDRLTRGAPC
tara:strand:- start:4 stop:105 length:102 start_codon:yes stop_codon:yes gene_type:complete